MEGGGSKEREKMGNNEGRNKEKGKEEGRKEGTVKTDGVDLTREDNRKVKP